MVGLSRLLLLLLLLVLVGLDCAKLVGGVEAARAPIIASSHAHQVLLTSFIVKLIIKDQLVIVLASIFLIIVLIVKGFNVVKEGQFKVVDYYKGNDQALECLVPKRNLL